MQDSSSNVKIFMTFENEGSIPVLDLSSFLFDINRIYSISLRNFTSLPGLVISPVRFNRNSFKLPTQFELHITRIKFESPGFIEIAAATMQAFGTPATVHAGFLATIASFYVVVQILEKISIIPLTREKLQLEIRKLKVDFEEAGHRHYQRTGISIDPQRMLEDPAVISALKSLQQSSLKPAKIDFDFSVNLDDRF